MLDPNALITAYLGALALTIAFIRSMRNMTPFISGMAFPSHLHKPFLGVAANIGSIEGTQRVVVDGADSQGLVSYYLLSAPFISATRADHVRQILLASNDRNPVPIMTRHIGAFLGDSSILLLNRATWKFHRRLFAKAFNWQFLEGMAPTMSRVAHAFTDLLLLQQQQRHQSNKLDVIDQGVDIFPLIKLATLDIIGLTGFGYDFHAIQDGKNPVASAFEFLLAEMTRRTYVAPLHPANFFYWLPTAANRRYHREQAILRSTLEDIVTARLKQRSSTGPTDLLDNMITAMNAQDDDDDDNAHDDTNQTTAKEMTPASFVDQLLSFLFAGFDTTSIALAYTFYLISQHPDVEAKMLAEIHDVVGPDANVTYASAQALPYVTAVFKEAMRLFPPVPFYTRTIERDNLVLGPFTIPKGTHVLLPVWSIHRSRMNWGPRADMFLPERHLDKKDDAVNNDEDTYQGSEKDKSFRFLAFSGGPRNCVGMRFAMLEAVVVLVTVLRRCKFTRPVNAPPVVPESAGLVQTAKHGIWLHVHAR
jgi:cytochrome P450